MTNYLIDASIIASSQEDFQRRFVTNSNCTLFLSNITYKELEDRKKDAVCVAKSKKFVRFLIDLFVRDVSTKICFIDNCDSCSKHIDEDLVKFAKANNMSILTCDKGMALWCRFYQVDFELLETRSVAKLPFVIENDNSVYVNLFNGSITKGTSIYVYSPVSNKIIAPLENGIIFLNTGYILLVAHPENNLCCIDTYYVDREKMILLTGRDFYSSVDDIDKENRPFHQELYRKWVNYTRSCN